MGIYIHIPFCRQACIYCDFHFSTVHKGVDEMVSAIHKEIILRKDYLKGASINTIYFGGGTPSLLNEKQLSYLLHTIRAAFTIEPSAEITLEANPDDLNADYLKMLKANGVNRLSIGVQSFDEDDLKFMNRAHNASQARECIALAQQEGFDNITIDLIYGSPALTPERWKQNMQIAFDTGVSHLSAYSLTVEPRTVLASLIKNKKAKPLDEELAALHFEMLMDAAVANGFEHYEISNFARDKKYSKHNTSYWQGKPYLGVGPSAHSFDGLSRQWNVYNNAVYVRNLTSGIVPYEKEELTKKDMFNEYILTSLRTQWGISKDYLQENHKLFYPSFEEQITPMIKEETVEFVNGFFRLTRKGKFFADRIASDLFQ